MSLCYALSFYALQNTNAKRKGSSTLCEMKMQNASLVFTHYKRKMQNVSVVSTPNKMQTQNASLLSTP